MLDFAGSFHAGVLPGFWVLDDGCSINSMLDFAGSFCAVVLPGFWVLGGDCSIKSMLDFASVSLMAVAR